MHPLIKCLIYLAAVGLAAFFLGRLLPKDWFSYGEAPFRAFPFERGGKIYEALGIRKWKDRLPDMSRILPRLIPSKALPKATSARQVEAMLRETCVAELTHGLLCILGWGCIKLWKGAGGWVLWALYALGNLPFCMIQRYNRPKLARLLARLQAKEHSGKGTQYEQGFDIKLQYGARA
ncbi:MAG: glycosyl-4,4'-diaponeurosporenoate acyltransferase [Eubacteriales bacterium]|nr:glycosyl-4,4'-diaponeurosporenoate acyltransferase [Eubacteriales bacterium]